MAHVAKTQGNKTYKAIKLMSNQIRLNQINKINWFRYIRQTMLKKKKT